MSVLIPCYDVPQDSLASLCAMLLCSCTVNVDPWKVRKTITPERYDDPSMRKRLLKIADDTHGGLSKKGKAYHLYYTRKSFVLYLVEQCGLTDASGKSHAALARGMKTSQLN